VIDVRRIRALVAVCAASSTLALAGCAVVRIQTTGKDDVEVKQRFGIVSVEIKPGAGATLVESTSLGAINGVQGFALGYHSAQLAALAGERCQLVVWIKTGEELKQLDELLRDRTDVCVVRPDESGRGRP
jgi:hypothetical protein